MKKIKILIDILLLINTILLNNIEISGYLFHEILGIAMLILIIIHLFLNWNWIKNITRNLKKVNKRTKIIYAINILTMIVYIGAIIFGISISNELFRLKTSSNIYLVLGHLILGRLAIIVMFIHIGVNFNIIFKKVKNQKLKLFMYIIYIIIFLLVSIYSIYRLTHCFQWMYFIERY